MDNEIYDRLLVRNKELERAYLLLDTENKKLYRTNEEDFNKWEAVRDEMQNRISELETERDLLEEKLANLTTEIGKL